MSRENFKREFCDSCNGYGWTLGWENQEKECYWCKGWGVILVTPKGREMTPDGRFIGSRSLSPAVVR